MYILERQHISSDTNGPHPRNTRPHHPPTPHHTCKLISQSQPSIPLFLTSNGSHSITKPRPLTLSRSQVSPSLSLSINIHSTQLLSHHKPPLKKKKKNHPLFKLQLTVAQRHSQSLNEFNDVVDEGYFDFNRGCVYGSGSESFDSNGDGVLNFSHACHVGFTSLLAQATLCLCDHQRYYHHHRRLFALPPPPPQQQLSRSLLRLLHRPLLSLSDAFFGGYSAGGVWCSGGLDCGSGSEEYC